MTCAKTGLTALRIPAVLLALAAFGLGIWTIIIIHEIEHEGIPALDAADLDSRRQEHSWRTFFNAAIHGTTLSLVYLTGDIAAALASIMVILANRHYRLQIAPAIVLLLEFMALALIAVSFGCTLSLALSLSSFRTARLYTGGSAKLASFAALLSVSKVCTIITALAGFLVMMTCLMSVVDAYNRHQQSEKVCCAFEPTASALGMNHGFEALHPSEPYTSYKPRYTSYIDVKRPPMTDGLARSASQNAVMGRIGSGQSKRCQGLPDVEKDMLRLLGPEKSNDSPKPPKSARPERPAKIGRSPKPERSPKITSPETIEILTKPARPVRPVRPWSKVWNGRESMYGF